MSEIQPDIAAYMATLGTTNDDLAVCNSCQRALLYGAMMYAGAVKADLEETQAGIAGFRPWDAVKALKAAIGRADTLIRMLAEFAKADLIGSLPGAAEYSAEDWAMAMDSFFRARTEFYVSPEGQIIFEPHTSVEGGPEDGVPAL